MTLQRAARAEIVSLLFLRDCDDPACVCLCVYNGPLQYADGTEPNKRDVLDGTRG